MNTAYQDALDSLMFARMHDNYFADEIRSARRDEDISDLAARIADEVVYADNDRRKAFTEEIVDNEVWINFVRDLLDDVRNNVDPTGTIKRSVFCWALSVAEYEVSRGEA